MDKISYVDINFPLKTKHVRNCTGLLFDNELRTLKRSKRKIEKTYRNNGSSQAKSGFLKSVLEYFELFTKKKNEYLEKCVASENRLVSYSMLQQLLDKSNAIMPQLLGEPECLANKFNAFFVKKMETVLAPIPLTYGLKLNNSHTTTLDFFSTFYIEQFEIASTENFEQYGTE